MVITIEAKIIENSKLKTVYGLSTMGWVKTQLLQCGIVLYDEANVTRGLKVYPNLWVNRMDGTRTRGNAHCARVKECEVNITCQTN